MQREIGYLLKMINDNYHSIVNTKLKSKELTSSQSRVLYFIDRSGGSVTQKQIETFLDVSHPTVVGLLSRLQKSGYIECGYDKSHGKNKLVTQTEKAHKFSEEMESFFAENNRVLLEGLMPGEEKELERMLNILYENVRKRSSGQSGKEE